MAKFLDVFAVTTNGQIKHTFRKENNGNWQSFFGDIEQTINREVGHFVEVAVRKNSPSDIDGICLVDQTGKCYYASKRIDKRINVSNVGMQLAGLAVITVMGVKNKMDNWNIFSSTGPTTLANSIKRMLSTEHYTYLLYDNNTGKGIIEENKIASTTPTSSSIAVSRHFPADFPSFADFDACVNSANEYLITAAGKDGNIYIIQRKMAYGELSLLSPVLSLPNGEKCVRVSCCISVGDLHITAVSQQGNIYHGIYIKQNNFGDIQGVTGRAGSFTDISCADINGVLHVVGTTNDGRILHTFRRKNGSWQNFFGDIESKTGEAGHFVSVSISAREE